MVGLIINLINMTHYLSEMREYAFMVFREYTIIFSIFYGPFGLRGKEGE